MNLDGTATRAQARSGPTLNTSDGCLSPSNDPLRATAITARDILMLPLHTSFML